ncbi:ParM/StbA family protein [Natranaerobius thermophilus]|uniref:Actin-like protein N-terminal domain-containing protein n=1 Tax=Natranaerobius thermophilus (strain ATCC BAA-1301 / DSM 18059 / JW/NM-WN-LF) TaxID=457570 RepID=B2A0N9_NATTJ|nr:ParM/StbA family protein [Natranaerobius thermophilus]ACB85919.1 conserved hypothetical protein [Natranaerobius thermophilus JW/NM-WN-LF]
MVWGSIPDKDRKRRRFSDGISEEDEVISEEEEHHLGGDDAFDRSVKNVGIDLGYGYVKFIDGKEPKMFPSVVGYGNSQKYKSALQLDLNPLDDLQIKIGDEHFFIGDLAIRQSEVASRSLGKDRSQDKNARVLMLTALSLLSSWDKQGFNLVTGLPTNFYAAFAEEWESTLNGEFKTKMKIGGKTQERSFQIEEVTTLPQPFGTLYDQVLNSVGKVVDRDLTDSKIGIVDIGFKTTDLAVSDGMEFINPLSFSTTTGLSNVNRLVNEKLRHEFKIDREEHQLDDCINSQKIMVAGKSEDISSWVREALQTVSDKISVEIESKWDYRDFDTLLLTGGGGEMLYPYLKDKFPNLVLVEDPQTANVRGYQKLANNLFNA